VFWGGWGGILNKNAIYHLYLRIDLEAMNNFFFLYIYMISKYLEEENPITGFENKTKTTNASNSHCSA
jgi:hypothetical protein